MAYTAEEARNDQGVVRRSECEDRERRKEQQLASLRWEEDYAKGRGEWPDYIEAVEEQIRTCTGFGADYCLHHFPGGVRRERETAARSLGIAEAVGDILKEQGFTAKAYLQWPHENGVPAGVYASLQIEW
jgi:hypothetical protein